jgi:hypothetical protein
MPIKQQRELARALGAKTVTFDQGHMGDKHVKQELFEACVAHLDDKGVRTCPSGLGQ